MCILIFIIGMAMIIPASISLNQDFPAHENLKQYCVNAGVAICILSMSGILATTYLVVDGRLIDEKIQMYMEENTRIEEQMTALVSRYMEYESDTYREFRPSDSIQLVTLYPDLKSDKLVQKQCDAYISNNNKIKSLRKDKINLSTARWFLYFGH